MKMKLLRYFMKAAIATSLIAPLATQAADAVNGKSLYMNTTPVACSVCHGTDVSKNQSKILSGTDWTKIRSAITGDKGGMGMYTALTDAQLMDIAAYIANPNGATPMPAVSLSASSISFGSVNIGTTAAAKTVTLSNTGTAALTISSITLGGTNASDFMKSGTCAAGQVAAGASCTLGATFTPAAAGTRAASFSIVSNAANSPHTVSMSGTGVTVTVPAPVASISPMSLSLGSVQVGMTSAAQTVKISNTGNAALSVGAISVAGANAADFSATGCANTSVAAGASCNVSVTFKPSVASAETASLSIAHNATGSPGTVALSGTGTAAPPTGGAPMVSFSPMSLTFDPMTVGMSSGAKTVTVNNTGTAALTISGWSVTGTNAGDFAVATGGTCTAGASVAAGASCTAKVTFTPSMSGARTASLNLQSNASGAYSVGLSGMGVSDTNGLIQLTQNGLVIYKIKVEDDGKHAKILIKNTSNKTIKVEKITFLVGKNYKIEDQCSGKSLKPGKTCEIEIAYKGSKDASKPDDDEHEEVVVTTDTGATMSLPIDLQPASAVGVTTGTTDSTAKVGGGCTIGGEDQFDLSQLAMLGAAIGVMLLRRRKQQQRMQ